MATYAELKSAENHSGLQEKVEVAIWVAATAIIVETPSPANHAQRLKWAAQALANPRGTMKAMLPAVIATNKGVTLSQITGASDMAVQTALEAVIDLFADLIV